VVGSCIYFYGITHNCWIALEADFANIRITSKDNKVCWTAVFCVLWHFWADWAQVHVFTRHGLVAELHREVNFRRVYGI
jgi:hypothetical protein